MSIIQVHMITNGQNRSICDSHGMPPYRVWTVNPIRMVSPAA